MTDRIVGVDPGKTTGVAVIDSFGNILEAHQFPFEEAPQRLDKLIRKESPNLVGLERYHIGATYQGRIVKQEYEALYVMGGVIFLCSLSGVTKLRLQNPSDAKNAFTNDALRVYDNVHNKVHVPTPHGRDALRHALLAARAVYGNV